MYSRPYFIEYVLLFQRLITCYIVHAIDLSALLHYSPEQATNLQMVTRPPNPASHSDMTTLMTLMNGIHQVTVVRIR